MEELEEEWRDFRFHNIVIRERNAGKEKEIDIRMIDLDHSRFKKRTEFYKLLKEKFPEGQHRVTVLGKYLFLSLMLYPLYEGLGEPNESKAPWSPLHAFLADDCTFFWGDTEGMTHNDLLLLFNVEEHVGRTLYKIPKRLLASASWNLPWTL